MSGVRVLGIIQARMSSARLPGKVLRMVGDKPLLAYLTERVMPSRAVDRWVVATSMQPEDTAIAQWCATAGVPCFRGSLEDVLDRFYRCACAYRPATVVRVTADCPLHHFEVVDFAVRAFMESGADYMTNSFPPTLEDGFDTEVFRFECLEAAWRHARAPHAREHVTPAIRSDERLRRVLRKFHITYDYKLSVDTAEEFAAVSQIIQTLAPRGPLFTMAEVVALVEARPDWGVARLQEPAGARGSSHS